MSEYSGVFPFLMVILILALFAAVIVWMVRRDRRHKEEKRLRAAALGFQPVDPLDPVIQEKIFALHTRSGRRLELRNLFRRRGADYDLYLFDLWDTAGEDSSVLVDNGVLVTSPYLRLPMLSLYSKIEASGFLADAANKLINRLMMSQNRLEFPQAPDFNRRFWVTSPEADAAHAFLRPDLLARLDSLKNVQITAGGDAFTLAPAVQGGYVYRSGPGPDQVVAQTIQDAERAARWLME